jgi:two-component system phosphate regulon response regulator PhoB/two-component system alkaline phosphatase synthesis response regulator PhoP/two-component system response regulator VicR
MNNAQSILIIDDDRDLVNSIRIILESKDYKVRAAFDGQEGFRQIQEEVPDLIILDVMMTTDTEGFDLAYKLNQDPEFKNIPILMVTSFPQKMAEQGPSAFQHILGENWPVSQFLEKPLHPDQILKAVEDLLP